MSYNEGIHQRWVKSLWLSNESWAAKSVPLWPWSLSSVMLDSGYSLILIPTHENSPGQQFQSRKIPCADSSEISLMDKVVHLKCYLMVVHGNPWISINSHKWQWTFRLGKDNEKGSKDVFLRHMTQFTRQWVVVNLSSWPLSLISYSLTDLHSNSSSLHFSKKHIPAYFSMVTPIPHLFYRQTSFILGLFHLKSSGGTDRKKSWTPPPHILFFSRMPWGSQME